MTDHVEILTVEKSLATTNMENHEDELIDAVELDYNSLVQEDDVQHQSKVVSLYCCQNENFIANNR